MIKEGRKEVTAVKGGRKKRKHKGRNKKNEGRKESEGRKEGEGKDKGRKVMEVKEDKEDTKEWTRKTKEGRNMKEGRKVKERTFSPSGATCRIYMKEAMKEKKKVGLHEGRKEGWTI